jgi:hypothetical protein
MARSTFEGPILSGDNKFGPLRNVGYSQLVQNIDLDFSNTTSGTSTYGGASTVFVSSNNVPNVAATVYIPSATTFPSAAYSIPADTASQIYRGAVLYIPAGADLDNIYVDVGVVPTTSGTAPTTIKVYVSNAFTTEASATPTYFATGNITAVGRQALATFTAAQILAQTATTTDITQANGYPNLSQVVIVVSIAGATMGTLATGKINFTLQYTQPDNNIGSTTAYPYGNFD